MINIYDKNGLLFFSETEIDLRELFVRRIVGEMRETLRTLNRAFDFFRCEAPMLTPSKEINQNYTECDVFNIEDLTLRPETTMGSYAYASHLLNPHNNQKVKMPIVVWQHGKSFRREQDQVTKNMRLKEFYQLEFQIIYGLTTANNYGESVVPAVRKMIADLIGPCKIEDSDRLPAYSEWTKDIICEKNNMEVASISQRKDYTSAKNLEVAIGTDRLLFNFNEK